MMQIFICLHLGRQKTPHRGFDTHSGFFAPAECILRTQGLGRPKGDANQILAEIRWLIFRSGNEE
jgi:hypothetical protein